MLGQSLHQKKKKRKEKKRFSYTKNSQASIILDHQKSSKNFRFLNDRGFSPNC